VVHIGTKLYSVKKSDYHPNVTGSCVLPKKITTTTLLEGIKHDFIYILLTVHPVIINGK
jgi:hypothetical protein